MSHLAHAVCETVGFEPERRDLDQQIRHETTEVKRIQRETGCSWQEAMRLATLQADTAWDNWKAVR